MAAALPMPSASSLTPTPNGYYTIKGKHDPKRDIVGDPNRCLLRNLIMMCNPTVEKVEVYEHLIKIKDRGFWFHYEPMGNVKLTIQKFDDPLKQYSINKVNEMLTPNELIKVKAVEKRISVALVAVAPLPVKPVKARQAPAATPRQPRRRYTSAPPPLPIKGKKKGKKKDK